jgi:hypothetical protein
MGSPGSRQGKKEARFARQNLPGALISCRAGPFRKLQNASLFNRLAGCSLGTPLAIDCLTACARFPARAKLDGDVAWVFLMH